jgi:hypothetical protein
MVKRFDYLPPIASTERARENTMQNSVAVGFSNGFALRMKRISHDVGRNHTDVGWQSSVHGANQRRRTDVLHEPHPSYLC